MLRFEGLLKAGVASYDCFYDQVYALKDALIQQVQDRRSAIARQACHLLCCLAVALGNRFEHMAHALLPVLLKVTPITVQVRRCCFPARTCAPCGRCRSWRMQQTVRCTPSSHTATLPDLP